MSVVAALERVPPQNLEAEQAVLGSMLLERDAIAKVVEAVQPPDFYREAHRTIYQAMVELFEKGEPVDLISLTDRLRDQGDLDDVGGATYLAQLLNIVPTAANVEYYARIVVQKAMLRGLISAGTQIAQLGYRGDDDVEMLIDQAEKLVFAIGQRRMTQEFVPIRAVLIETFEKLDRRGKGDVTGLPTGFTDLDLLTAGLQPSDLVIVAGRPSMGKCLGGNAEIVLENGRVATIEELYRERQGRLLTLGDDWTFRFTTPSAFVDDGIKPVFRVTTRLGRSIETTATHPFLTMRGWRPLAELRAGERVAVPRTLPVFGNRPLRECEVRLLAYLIGDGGLTAGRVRFTNTSPRIVDDFQEAVAAFGGVRARAVADRSASRSPSYAVAGDPSVIARGREDLARQMRAHVGIRRGARARLARQLDVSPASITNWLHARTVPDEPTFARLRDAFGLAPLASRDLAAIRRNSKNPLALWLGRHGLSGAGARSKAIPPAVFTLPREQLALFINRLFATDGWASVQTKVAVAQIGYGSVSERLIRQVQHLLLRFGVVAKIRRRMVRYKGARRPAWQLEITDQASVEAFAVGIGIFGEEQAVQRVREVIAGKGRKVNRDTVPPAVWTMLAEARGGEAWKTLAERAGIAGTSNIHVGTRGLSRDRLGRLAQALGDEPLQRLAESDVYWDQIVAIEPAGMKQVYDLTIPETHNFVANDVCVHNTTLGLNIAQHAAISHKTPVAIFSLETSKEQLVQRILCAEAGVDNSRLRTGFLTDDDWRRISRAVGTLSEAKIFVDDSANITVVEMRAKARKLMAEHGLGLIIIDYIQLIQSYKRTENRTQEISEIARSLKGLAKELNIPVIITSQLSRAVELTGTRRPMLSHLRECVTGDTAVWDADTGRRHTVAELAGRTGWPRLLSLDGNGTIVAVRPSAVFGKGDNEVFEIRTSTGRRLRATANHPVLTPDGWKTVGELRPGSLVAAARRLPVAEPRQGGLSPDRMRLLGYLIGDGSYQRHRGLSFISADPVTFEDCITLAEREFGVLARRGRANGTPEVDFAAVYPKNGSARAYGRPYGNPLREWLRELGVEGQSAYDKRVPERVFWDAGPEAQRALLRGLFSTDGCLTRRRYRNGTFLWSLHYDTVSLGLAQDVRDLLLRFGIVSQISSGYKSTKATVPIYRVCIEDARHLAECCRTIGIEGRKDALVAACLAELTTRRTKPLVDRLPYAITEEVWELKRAAGHSWRTLGFRLQKGKTLDRPTLARLAETLQAPHLAVLARNDLLWDRVVSVTPAGREPVYDLVMPGTHNFVANGLVVHNSGELEQVADLVVFLYRDDYYDPATERKNVAEVIVAKHRNGPTGTIELYFHKEHSRFANLERRRA